MRLVELQSAVPALEIYSPHPRKLCDKLDRASDHKYFHSFYFRGFEARLLQSIFTRILPSFILLQLFLLPLIQTAQSAELPADANRRVR